MEQEIKQTHRRYKEGREFHYDYQFASGQHNSRILNENYEPGELEELVEIKEKRMQLLQDELDDVVKAQKLSKQTAFNKGSQWDESDRSREKRVTLEAQIDVARLEIDKLHEAIEEAEKEKEEEDVQPCLPRGIEGINQVRGTTGSGYYDGQKVEPINGLPVIVDQRSPYHGISVLDLTEKIVKPWIRVHGRGSRLPLPEIPANVKNHLSNGKASLQRTSKPKLVRTKR